MSDILMTEVIDMTTTNTPTRPPSLYRNGAEWLDDLGDVPLERVIFDPWPGMATEQDLLRKVEVENHPCELINGTLVEKPMGFAESMLAAALIEILRRFVRPNKLGIITAPDATMRLKSGLVRLPDVAFISFDRLPN